MNRKKSYRYCFTSRRNNILKELNRNITSRNLETLVLRAYSPGVCYWINV